jgi:para-nitrobenzyl esterase
MEEMKMKAASMALAVLVLLASSAAGASPGSGPIVMTHSGPVRGERAPTVDSFEGIPYAHPPTEEGRWRPPQPVNSWRAPRDATKPGPACAQNDPGKPAGTLLPGSSEDCLYLNVTSPRHQRRPVIVWIHGGGNTSGSGSEYDATRMATRGDVVVVTINYRLGVFGFFGYPGLTGSGTFGLQDQQAALRWVHANVAAFGGDPADVTIAGQSAGGVDICAQLTAPGSAGLFTRAILQSGSCRTKVPTYADLTGHVQVSTGGFFAPVKARETAGQSVARQLGCAGTEALRCLRHTHPDPADLLKYEAAGFGPAFGTGTLPENPVTALAAGRVHPVPVLSGNTRDEARLTTMLVELLAGPFTAQSYDSVLRTTFGAGVAGAIERTYPAGADAGLAFATMDTDRVFACPQLETGHQLARVSRTYGYEFADPDAPTYSMYFSPRPPGASHAAELAYLFDLRGGAPYRGTTHAELTAPQQALANSMIDIWTDFARTGRVPWPTQPAVQSLAPRRIGPVDGWAEHHCALWATLS